MSGPLDLATRERLARWIRTSAPAVVSGAAAPEEVVDALLDILLALPDDSLICEAGRAELPSRRAAEAKAVFAAMIQAVKDGL